MVDHDCASSTIPICNVTGRILAMVIERWNKHEIGTVFNEKEQNEWESRFRRSTTSGSREGWRSNGEDSDRR
ncbi:hypothetical protein Ddye_001895, partial [Dipteronia dyeriana]